MHPAVSAAARQAWMWKLQLRVVPRELCSERLFQDGLILGCGKFFCIKCDAQIFGK